MKKIQNKKNDIDEVTSLFKIMTLTSGRQG